MESRIKCKTCPRMLFPEEVKRASWNWRGKRVWVEICDKCFIRNSKKQSFTDSLIVAQQYDKKARDARVKLYLHLRDPLIKHQIDKEIDPQTGQRMPIARPTPRRYGLYFSAPKENGIGSFFFSVFDNNIVSVTDKIKKDGGTYKAHTISTRCRAFVTPVNKGEKERIYQGLFNIQDNTFVDCVQNAYPKPLKINPMKPDTGFMGKAFLYICVGTNSQGYNEFITVTNETLKDLSNEIINSPECNEIREVLHEVFDTDFTKIDDRYPFLDLKPLCWHPNLSDYILKQRMEKGADTIDGGFIKEDGTSDEIPF